MIVRLEKGFKIRPMRPRPRELKRFITSALPTWACATTNSSTSRSWLFSALAIADSRHLRTSFAMRLCENSRSASALATFFPRINCATRLSFCGEIRSILLTAFASFSLRSRSRWRLPMSLLVYLSARRCSGGRCHRSGARRSRSDCALGFVIGRMAVEHPGRRELAELVTDHFFVHQHRNVLLPVIDAEIQPNELRENGRAPAPDLDHLVAAR